MSHALLRRVSHARDTTCTIMHDADARFHAAPSHEARRDATRLSIHRIQTRHGRQYTGGDHVAQLSIHRLNSCAARRLSLVLICCRRERNNVYNSNVSYY